MQGFTIGSILGTLLTSVLLAQPVHVTIDIKPGNTPTTIEPNSRGVLPVAILTTAQFDATTIDPETVRIGPTGTEADVFRSMQEDVNHDGRTDLLVLVRVQDMKANCDTTIIRLTGKTTGGVSIEGSEKVTTDGCVTVPPSPHSTSW